MWIIYSSFFFLYFYFLFDQGACDLSSVDHGVVSVTEIKKSWFF